MRKITILAAAALALAALPTIAASIDPQTGSRNQMDCATAERVPGTSNWRAAGRIEIQLFRRIPDGPFRGLPDNYLIQIDPDRFPGAAVFGPDVEIDNDAWCVGHGRAIQASECDREAGMERLSKVGNGREYAHLYRNGAKRNLRGRLAQAAEFFAAACLTK